MGSLLYDSKTCNTQQGLPEKHRQPPLGVLLTKEVVCMKGY